MAYSCPKHGLRSGQDVCTICTPERCSCGVIRPYSPPMTSDKYEVPDPHANCKWYADEYVKGEGGLKHELGRVDGREQIWQ